MKKFLFLAVSLAVLLIGANAFALTNYTLDDLDTYTHGATSWTQAFALSDFKDGQNNPLPSNYNSLTILSPVTLVLNMNVHPDGGSSHTVTFDLKIAGVDLGNQTYNFSNSGNQNYTWTISNITNSAILTAMADRSLGVSVSTAGPGDMGTINYINSSEFKGSATAAPEPITMALMGAGIVALPFARRLKQSFKKE